MPRSALPTPLPLLDPLFRGSSNSVCYDRLHEAQQQICEKKRSDPHLGRMQPRYNTPTKQHATYQRCDSTVLDSAPTSPSDDTATASTALATLLPALASDFFASRNCPSCSSFGAAFFCPGDRGLELSMGCRTRQSNGGNYHIDPALQLLYAVALPNETRNMRVTQPRTSFSMARIQGQGPGDKKVLKRARKYDSNS
jgi:hypothetical protein